MKLNQVRDNEGSRTSRMRVARGYGSGKGRTAGRGVKGQTSRSGVAINGFEGGQMPMTRRLPKIGFNNKRFAHVYNQVNIDVFNRFEDGAVVGIDELVASGIIKKVEPYGLKVLGNGVLEKKLTIKANKFTASAVEKIEKAGGTVEVL